MFLENLLFIIPVWITTFLVGFISWPTAYFFFRSLSDRGYSISKILGFLIIGYLIFLLATLKIIKLDLPYFLIIISLWTAFNFFLNSKLRLIRKEDIKLKRIFSIEFFFLSLFSFWVFVRSFNPEIRGIERFMDFGFLQSLFQTNTLPAHDMWFLGGYINYYYFGHFLGYLILSLSRVDPVPGFLTLVALIFAILGINVYRLGHDLISLLWPKSKKEISILSGCLSFCLVMLAGNWYTYSWLFQKLKQIFLGGLEPYFWYPDATRIIPGTITEMPIYSFLEADLHPHMWGLLNGILILTVVYAFWKNKKFGLNLKNPYLWLIAFILGVSYMTNSWDALTLGILSIIILFFRFFLIEKLKFSKIVQFLKLVIFIAVFSYIFALPWSLFYQLPVKGIGIVSKRSPFLPWISFWGPFVSVLIVFLGRVIWLKLKNKKIPPFHLALIFASIFFLIFMELFYVKDLFDKGEFFRVNTVFKITNQVWLWLGTVLGSIIIWLFFSFERRTQKIIFCLILFLTFIGPFIYPLKTLWQARLSSKKIIGLTRSLDWWKENYPYDYEAYLFLKNLQKSLPKEKKVKNIVEAEGESFTDSARFSTFLGWPTIIGWPIHEWTWRGTYDIVGPRVEEVKEIYTGKEREETEKILKKYKIDYLIIGEIERERYKENLNLEKLLSLGEIIFQNEKTIIIGLRE